jgi:hypothetical protein
VLRGMGEQANDSFRVWEVKVSNWLARRPAEAAIAYIC